MSFLSSLTDFVDQLPTDLSGNTLAGLDLAESEIDKVIKVIEDQQALLNPTTFKNRGHISEGSFGGGDRAPDLALHHHRAHGVTADTLEGVLEDLRTFQTACRDAKLKIVEADVNASDDLRAKQAAAETLTFGSMTNEGQQAHQQAQVEHQDDETSETPDQPTGDDSQTEGS